MCEKTSTPCGCNKTDDETHRIEDGDVIFQVQHIPISLTLSLVVVQCKDREILADDIPKDAILVEQNGIFTLTVPEIMPNRIAWSSLFSKKTLTGRHRASGTGGVWNGLKLRCDSRTCSVDCRDTSCEAVLSACARRFDSVCSQFITCFNC